MTLQHFGVNSALCNISQRDAIPASLSLNQAISTRIQSTSRTDFCTHFGRVSQATSASPLLICRSRTSFEGRPLADDVDAIAVALGFRPRLGRSTARVAKLYCHSIVIRKILAMFPMPRDDRGLTRELPGHDWYKYSLERQSFSLTVPAMGSSSFKRMHKADEHKPDVPTFKPLPW